MERISKEDIKGITSFTTYDSGELEECRLSDFNIINTKYGKLVPQYMNPGIRRKDSRALSFYKNGRVRSISLDEQTEIETPIGKFPAELVTFFEDGSIDSLFPLNGQLSFSWSEVEEGNLAQKFKFNFGLGSFTTKISGIRFYKNGNVRSLILWPNEMVEIISPVGKIAIRIGFKLYEDGKIESIEPATPYLVNTPIGMIKAFDEAALAVDADRNSMKFDRQGNLSSLVTSGDIIMIHKITGDKKTISSDMRLGLMEDDLVQMPIVISFAGNSVKIDNGKDEVACKINEYSFEFNYDDKLGKSPRYGECTECSGYN
ncbi:MAG: hypothetical protein ACERKZ_13095 [Lachnotalea sp.]